MTDLSKLATCTDIPDDLLKIYLSSGEVAVDTELHGLKLHRDEICLVQICDDKDNLCLVKPDIDSPPPNLRKLVESTEVIKVFHFALTDVAFFKTSLGMTVTPFHCTKVMSKMIRTYTDGHGLKDLTKQICGFDLEKQMQQTDWSSKDLSQEQLKYAANDVLNLIKIYRTLDQMIKARCPLYTGGTVEELNEKAQAVLPNLIDLLIAGYGDEDRGWQTKLFTH